VLRLLNKIKIIAIIKNHEKGSGSLKITLSITLNITANKAQDVTLL